MSCASWHVGGWLPCQRGVAAVVDDCGGPLTFVFLFDAAGLCALFLRIAASFSILCPPSHCCSIINRTVQCAECLTMLEERMNDLYEYAGPLQPEELHCVVTPDCLGLVGGGGGKGGRGRTCPASEQRVKVRMMLGGEVGWAGARWDGRGIEWVMLSPLAHRGLAWGVASPYAENLVCPPLASRVRQ